MRFTLQREVLLKPLQQVVNVVERRQTMPVLANLLVSVKDNVLSVTASDTEVELVARCNLEGAEDGETTIPARKWFDILSRRNRGRDESFRAQAIHHDHRC